MRKYWKKLILFALMLVAAVVVGKGNVKAATIIDSGNCGLDGNDITYILDSDGLLTISGSGTIESFAFARNDNVKAVEIGAEIADMGDYTFYGCKNLQKVTISDGVKNIGDGAFGLCDSLPNIEIPASVETIGECVFEDCNLETLEVAEANPVYDSRNKCNALIETSTNTLIAGCKNTVIPDDITSIGDFAFYICGGLESISIPDSVTRIGDYAFYYCNLKNITIPASVEYIGERAFTDCNADYIQVEENNPVYDSRNNCNAIMKTAENKLLYGSNNTIIPADTESIESYAFEWCMGMSDIAIPDGVKKIGERAFRDCANVKTINIPASVTSIGPSAFAGMDDLESMSVDTANPVYDSRDNCNAIIETVTNKLVSACTNAVIPSSVTIIGKQAYANAAMENITIPATVTSLEEEALWNCYRVKNITIPEGVKKIGDRAFEACFEMEQIIISPSVTEIGSDVFLECKEDLVIYGAKGSIAEAYASENGIAFKEYDFSKNDSNEDSSGSDSGTSGIGSNDAGTGTGGAENGGVSAGGSATQPSGSASTGATGSALNSETPSTTETASAGTTTTKTKLTTKNTTIKLSKTSYTYDGKAKKPTVKVLNSKGKVLKSSNYTVKYSNNVKAGKATVTIKFKGKYTGTIKATYTIKPKTTAITGVTRNGNKVALIWKKQATQTSGYQIQYATDKKFTKDKQLVTASGAKKTSSTIKNVSEDKSYYFRIRTYKTVNGKKVYSAWSKVKLVKAEK